MVLALSYRDLTGTISETNKLVSELGQYCDDLSKKVQQKMYCVEGGMSTALNNADYYINAKISQLRTKENNVRTLSIKTQTLYDTARRVDGEVEKIIKSNQKSFFQKNPDLKAPWYQCAVTSFMCDMKNVPVLGWLIKGGEQVTSAFDQLGKDIKYWWKCGGGKELIMNSLDIALKVGLAVAAVITAVIAVVALATAAVITGGAILFAVAACVSAVIAVVNAVTNTVTSVQAIVASNAGNPAMSKIYSQRDTLAQVLREHNFHNRDKNRASFKWATGIEVTEAVSGVILLVQSVGEIANSFLSKNGVSFAFKELARGSDGTLTSKTTLSSIWKGTKAMVLNQKLTTSTSAGLRTTLFTNIKQSMNYQASLFKMAMRDPVNWVKTKQIGQTSFFSNIADKMRYGYWQLKNTAFQFRAGYMLYNFEKTSTLVNTTNELLSNTKRVLNGLDNVEGKGLIRRLSEKYVQDTLFDNDFTKLLNVTGIGGIIVNIDKAGTVSDFTGIHKGIIQKIGGIEESFENSKPTFKVLFPYYECVGGS